MHKNFSEWYRLVALEPDGTKLQKRWSGVKAWASALRNSDENLLETVRIFQGIPSKMSRDAFLAAFQEQDPAFPQRNDLELQVLAGASLVACVQSGGDDGAGLHTAILAGTALEASSLRIKEPRLDEISREVLEGLQTLAAKQRERKPFDRSAVSEKADEVTEALEQVAASSNWDQFKTAVSPVFQGLLDAVRAADREFDDAAHNLQCADEETNVLWWLAGGCSRDTNKPWTALKKSVAIIAGTELADLTDVALGPRNATALLERVLSESKIKGENTPLATYVNALPVEWACERKAKADDSALDLTPLSLAIVHRANSDNASWQQYFDASSGMKSSTQLPAGRMACQAYVEAILLRTLAGVDRED